MADDKTRDQEFDALIWAYLDGEIDDEQAEQLSVVLTGHDGVRKRFVESSVMHGMLHAYFRDERDSAGQCVQAVQADTDREKRKPRGKRSSAA